MTWVVWKQCVPIFDHTVSRESLALGRDEQIGEEVVCGCKLTYFLDPNNAHPVNPLAYRRTESQEAMAGAVPC